MVTEEPEVGCRTQELTRPLAFHLNFVEDPVPPIGNWCENQSAVDHQSASPVCLDGQSGWSDRLTRRSPISCVAHLVLVELLALNGVLSNARADATHGRARRHLCCQGVRLE